MTIKPSEFRKYWQQVPDQNIWRNKSDGSFVAVHGSTDVGWYVVKKTIPMSKEGGLGSMATEEISPYFILRTPTVGRAGAISNERVRYNKAWKKGNFTDALNYAYYFMYNYKPEIKQKEPVRYLL
jgi:hypothetical protein